MKKIVAFSATLLVSLGLLGVTGHAATTSASPSLSVNNVYTSSKTISGKATKGVNIVVRTASNKTIATAKASTTNGAYTVTLPSSLKYGTKLYVYAKNPTTGRYFYRIMTVKPATSTKSTSSSSKSTSSKTSSSKSSSTSKKTSTKSSTASKSTSTKSSSSSKKATAKPFIGEPTGWWTTSNSNGWKLGFSFRQKTGLNQRVYHNGKTYSPIVNAKYSVSPKSVNFWKINVTAKGGKNSSFYMRITSKTQFKLVNSKNQLIKTSIGNAPAGYYVFNLASK